MFRRVLNFFLRIEHREQDGARGSAEQEKSGLGRSGMVTATLIVGLVAASTFAYYERGRGNLSRLQRRIEPVRAVPTAPPPMPGGMPAIVLSRSQMIGEAAPQFLSATLLPGRGMNVLQITAYVPGRGEISLLASPTVEEAARLMTDAADDRNGAVSLSLGGAPMVPWAGAISGSTSGTTNGTAGGEISTSWQGRTLHLPATSGGPAGPPVAIGGLLLDRRSDSSDSTAMPDGSATTMTYHAGDFGGHWLSATDVNVSVLLSGRIVELTISARNVGTIPEPMGIGWQPRFAIPGQRKNVLLKIPGSKRIEQQERGSHLPTGRLVSVEGTPYDLRSRGGSHLPIGNFETTYTDLGTGFLDDGPIIEMTDAARSYGLRVKVLSSKIHAIHVAAPADGNSIEIAPQFNLDDPFGREWNKDVDTGTKVLEPGQAAEWKVRLEIFDPGAQDKAESITDAMPKLPSRTLPPLP